jgi:hypothetical protein
MVSTALFTLLMLSAIGYSSATHQTGYSQTGTIAA